MHADAEYNYRPFRKVWFAMALTDQSAFILCKANAAMFLEKARLRNGDEFRYEHCAETLSYYGQCVREVSSRLSDPVDCVSEGVFTTILGLICHDVCTAFLSCLIWLTLMVAVCRDFGPLGVPYPRTG